MVVNPQSDIPDVEPDGTTPETSAFRQHMAGLRLDQLAASGRIELETAASVAV